MIGLPPDRRTESDKRADALMFAGNLKPWTEEKRARVLDMARRLGASARRQRETMIAELFQDNAQ